MTRWLHRYAVAVSLSTLALIFFGGLVTSTDSGLAVPDWPLSYGRVMPPMIGGILFEHGHRLIAAAVGFMTVVLAAWLGWKAEDRRLKFAGAAAVALVVLQGALGGLTVLLRLPKAVSILHACLAQTFFMLTVGLAVWTSVSWRALKADDALRGALPRTGWPLCGVLYLQLVLGAVLRHTGHGVAWHVAGAALAAGLGFWTVYRLALVQEQIGVLWRWALLLGGALVLQLALGAASYVAVGFAAFGPRLSAALVTAHVWTGALLLGTSVVLALSLGRLGAGRPGARRLADYFTLTKPGISVMTGVTALAGFVLGSRGEVDAHRLIHTVIGTCLVSAGACALNMLLEIDVDARMRRTEDRPLPAKRLLPGEALLFGTLLSVAGVLYLASSVNFLTAFTAGVTLAVYLYLYTPLKKISALCTAVGAVAGALPPVIGWTAARGSLGYEAGVLFAILFFWQYPHFLSLAWIYREDYARAGLQMLPPLESDGLRTARAVVANTAVLLVVSAVPTFLGLTGRFYLATALVLGAGFLAAGLMFARDRSRAGARRLFFASVAYLPVLVALMVLDKAPHS